MKTIKVYDEASKVKIDPALIKRLDDLINSFVTYKSDDLIIINSRRCGGRYGMAACTMMHDKIKNHSPQEQNPTTGRVSRRSTCKRSYAGKAGAYRKLKPMADVKGGGSSRVQKLVDTTAG